MWFKTRYHLHAKEKINGVRKRGQCDSKHDITYILSKNKWSSSAWTMWFKTRYHLHTKEKINGVRKRGGCDSKHDITYKLRKK